MIVDEKKVISEDIKIKHPKHGYVKFFGLTTRQSDILKNYGKLIKKNKATVPKRRVG